MRKATLLLGLGYIFWGLWRLFTAIRAISLFREFSVDIPIITHILLPIGILLYGIIQTVSYFINFQKKRTYLILFISGLAFVVMWVGYVLIGGFVANKQLDLDFESTTSTTSQEIEEIKEVKELVNNFETAIKRKNVVEVMSYFTPPKNTEEKELYDSITTGPAGPRLFNNVASRFEIQSWKIARREYPDNKELISKENGRYLVVVEEVRRSWDPVKGGYSPWSPQIFVIEIIRFNNRWLIDKYFGQQLSPKKEISSLKYRGLGF